MPEVKTKVTIQAVDQASPALKAISGNLNQLQTNVNNVAQNLRSSAIVASSFGVAITGALTASVLNAASAEKQMAQFNNNLKTTGEAGEKAKESLLKAASAALKLGFSDEDAAVSASRLFQRTNDVAESTKLLTLAQDLATAKSIDLTSATTLITQVMSGGGRALKEYGIEISDTLTPLQALDELQKKVGGSATAASKTLSGQTAVIKQQFGELTERIGNALIPVLTQLIEKVTPIINEIIEWIDNNRALTGTITVVIGAVGLILTALAPLVIAIPAITATVTALGTALLFLTANPIGITITALALLGAAAFLVVKNWEQVKASLLSIWESLLNNLTLLFDSMVAYISQSLVGVQETVTSVWNGILSVTTTVWANIVSVIRSAVDTAKVIIESIVSAYNAVRDTLATPLNIVRNITDNVIQGAQSILPFAEGGIVTRPTIGLVGEAGREAIIPLSKLNDFFNPQQKLQPITVNMGGITVSNQQDADYLVSEVTRRIRLETLRSS